MCLWWFLTCLSRTVFYSVPARTGLFHFIYCFGKFGGCRMWLCYQTGCSIVLVHWEIDWLIGFNEKEARSPGGEKGIRGGGGVRAYISPKGDSIQFLCSALEYKKTHWRAVLWICRNWATSCWSSRGCTEEGTGVHVDYWVCKRKKKTLKGTTVNVHKLDKSSSKGHIEEGIVVHVSDNLIETTV